MTHPDQPKHGAQQQFPSPGHFAHDYLFRLFERQVTDTTDAVWCPEWWNHPEAVQRVWLLWLTYETAAAAGSEALSRWMLTHAHQHMQQLWSPTGPFRYCSARHGHKPLLGPLPCSWPAAPAELFTPRLAAAPAA